MSTVAAIPRVTATGSRRSRRHSRRVVTRPRLEPLRVRVARAAARQDRRSRGGPPGSRLGRPASASQLLDAYVNMLYRSLKNSALGLELASLLDAQESKPTSKRSSARWRPSLASTGSAERSTGGVGPPALAGLRRPGVRRPGVRSCIATSAAWAVADLLRSWRWNALTQDLTPGGAARVMRCGGLARSPRGTTRRQSRMRARSSGSSRHVCSRSYCSRTRLAFAIPRLRK
jgi:hypothetical protein